MVAEVAPVPWYLASSVTSFMLLKRALRVEALPAEHTGILRPVLPSHMACKVSQPVKHHPADLAADIRHMLLMTVDDVRVATAFVPKRLATIPTFHCALDAMHQRHMLSQILVQREHFSATRASEAIDAMRSLVRVQPTDRGEGRAALLANVIPIMRIHVRIQPHKAAESLIAERAFSITIAITVQ